MNETAAAQNVENNEFHQRANCEDQALLNPMKKETRKVKQFLVGSSNRMACSDKLQALSKKV